MRDAEVAEPGITLGSQIGGGVAAAGLAPAPA
jgi:hypothetical protein